MRYTEVYMNISAPLHNDRLCKALTGLSVKEFEELALSFAWNLQEAYQTNKPDRKRKVGGGRKGALRSAQEKLFAILVYLKTYPTYEFFGFVIGCVRSKAFRHVQILLPVLEQTLKRKLALPKRQIASLEEFLEQFPEAKDLFIDGTERRVQKPEKLRARSKLYSGKKKATTRKNIVVSDINKKVLVLTPTKSGRRHDKRLADKKQLARVIPPDTMFWVDTGFKGIEQVHTQTMIPKRASKKHPLTEEEKQQNKLISSIRILGEHAIGGIKRMKAATDTYRNHLPNLDDTFMLVSAGLWNYHLSFK